MPKKKAACKARKHYGRRLSGNTQATLTISVELLAECDRRAAEEKRNRSNYICWVLGKDVEKHAS
jgi:hypothetical protein